MLASALECTSFSPTFDVDNNLFINNQCTAGGGSGRAVLFERGRGEQHVQRQCRSFGTQGASFYASDSGHTLHKNIISSSVGASAFYVRDRTRPRSPAIFFGTIPSVSGAARVRIRPGRMEIRMRTPVSATFRSVTSMCASILRHSSVLAASSATLLPRVDAVHACRRHQFRRWKTSLGAESSRSIGNFFRATGVSCPRLDTPFLQP